MLKRPAVLLLVVFGLAGAVALVRTHFRRRQLTESAKSVEPAAMAARFHVGPPPCLRYLPSLDDVPQAEFDETARRLEAVALSSEQFADVLGHFITEHRSREASAHAAASVDEYLEQLGGQQADPLSKVAFWVQRELLRAKLSKLVDGANDELRNLETEGAVVWGSLTPEQRAALKALDAEHPLHLEVSGVLRVLTPLKVLTTHRRAKAIVELARQAKEKRPGFPVRMEDLSLPESQRLDAWSNAFVLSAGTDIIEVRSPGSDDGSPHDDIIETTNLGADVPPARGDDACGPLKGNTVLVKRSDVGSRVEPGANFVPFFARGAVRGFKVFGVRAGGPADRVGVCDGDVVLSVSGVGLDSAQKALEAWDAAKRRGSASLTIERHGVTGVLNVELRD
jgi:hypothetical protein